MVLALLDLAEQTVHPPHRRRPGDTFTFGYGPLDRFTLGVI